jgi:hypothetical protein
MAMGQGMELLQEQRETPKAKANRQKARKAIQERWKKGKNAKPPST